MCRVADSSALDLAIAVALDPPLRDLRPVHRQTLPPNAHSVSTCALDLHKAAGSGGGAVPDPGARQPRKA